MSSRLMFDMSEADMAFANELSEESLRKAVKALPDAVVRQLLFTAASIHMDVCKKVVTAADRAHFEVDASPRKSDLYNSRKFIINDEKLDVQWFQQETATALLLSSAVQRREALMKILEEIKVLVDLHQGPVALKAIFTVLPVLAQPESIPVGVWGEICSFDGPMLKLSHLLEAAIEACSAEQCKEYLNHLQRLCKILEGQGVTVFTPVYTYLKRKSFYNSSKH